MKDWNIPLCLFVFRFNSAPWCVGMVCLLSCMTACQTGSQGEQDVSLPASLTAPFQPGEEVMRKVLVLQQQQSPHAFGPLLPGSSEKVENHFVAVDSFPGGTYQFTQVYNTYTTPQGQTEHAVLSFALKPGESIRREVKDMRFVVEGDTAYFTDLSLGEIVQDSIFWLAPPNQQTPIYRLIGYAHHGDLDPSYHTYWTPAYGTLITWDGADRYIRLMGGPGINQAKLDEIVEGLARQVVPQWMEE